MDERPWYVLNELLAFLLELAALACLGWWGFAVGEDAALRVLLGVGTPLLAIVLWWLFAAPKARLRPWLPLVLAVKTVVLGGGVAALYGVRHPVAAVAMAVVVVVNTTLAEVFRRRPPGPRTGRPSATRSPTSPVSG
ncbi:YrdB family protein [Streptomyces filipinensis]|uniref:YrdB family protein n=1 Tax=Streptomyces filipinensis TaxID=66887 RepID=UPI001E426737|nr:YrdB family protein [Streptomyces filipinensis]